MADRNDSHPNIAPVERRVDAIQAAFEERGFEARRSHRASSRTSPKSNGFRETARAWSQRRGPIRRSAAPARQRPRRGRRAGPHDAASTIAISSCSRTRRRCRTSSAARSARAPRSRSSGCRRTGTRTSSTARAIVRQSRTVLKEMGLDLRPKSRSASGTRRPTRATWSCRCSRRTPWAGPKQSSRRSSRGIR